MKKNKINLFLHFGVEKTGSTSIQHILNKNRKDLTKAGLMYLGEDLTWNSTPCLNHQNFFKKINTISPEEQQILAKDKISNWVNFSKNRNINNFLISWESAKVPSPFLEALKKSPFLNIQPIIYVRNQIDWLKSGWKQYGCKIEGNESISDWVEHAIKSPFWEGKINWHKRIAELSKLFGDKNLIIKSYELEKLAIVESFLLIFNISINQLTDIEKAEDYNNKPLRADLLELVKHSRSLLSDPYSEEFTNLFAYYLKEDAFISSSKEGYKLNNSDIEKISDHFSVSNEFVAKTYFNLTSTELFGEIIIEDSEVEENQNQYSLEHFISTYVEILFKREQKLNTLEKKIRKQLVKNTNV